MFWKLNLFPSLGEVVGPNRLGVSHSPTWGQKQIHFPEHQYSSVYFCNTGWWAKSKNPSNPKHVEGLRKSHHLWQAEICNSVAESSSLVSLLCEWYIGISNVTFL
jgi:hypothetical protein